MTVIRRVQSLTNTQSYSSGNAFTQELGPLNFTVTRIDFHIEADFTTSGSPGTRQDYIHRLLSSLSLSSSLGTHLALQDLRPLHFENKLLWADKFVTPAAPGASATNSLKKMLIRVDFGVNPMDPFDLTGGIPKTVGNLTLNGTWAAATAVGSGFTINAGTKLRTKLYGVQTDNYGAEAIPRAIPVFQAYSATPPATTGSLGYTWNVPRGHFWHSSTVMVAAGSTPSDNRSDTAVNDIGLIVPVSGNAQRYYDTWYSHKQEYRSTGVADDDGSTFGTPTIAAEGDVGIGYLPVVRLATGGHPLYGLDMRNAAEGDVQIGFGIANNSNLALWMLQRQYDLNAAAGSA